MTVEELIEKLACFPSDMEVFVKGQDSDYSGREVLRVELSVEFSAGGEGTGDREWSELQIVTPGKR